MKVMYKLTIIFLVALISCKEKESANNKSKSEVKAKVESEFDKIKLTELDGEPIDLHQYEGKTIFINFWATWCGPCIQEMPSIQKAKSSLNDEDIVFLFASNEEVEAIEAFRTAIRLNPTFAAAHQGLGVLLKKAGDPLAEEELEKAQLLKQVVPQPEGTSVER